MLADELAVRITEAHQQDLEKRGAEKWPARTNTAGQLGWPCARKMFYKRTAHQEGRPFGPNAIARMDAGNVWEGATNRRLQDLGFDVEETQVLLDWPEYQIAGKLDGKVKDRSNGKRGIPFETKSLAHYGFEKLDSVEDMLNSKTIFYQMYPHQLNLYLLLSDNPSGLFVLRDRESGALKPIPMAVDFELGQQCLDRAEAVNEAIVSQTPPPHVEWCDWCEACDFLTHCRHPEFRAKPVDVIDDEETLAMLLEREELAAARKRYNEIDRALKKKLGRVVEHEALAGDFKISVKDVERKGYTVEKRSHKKIEIKRWKGEDDGH